MDYLAKATWGAYHLRWVYLYTASHTNSRCTCQSSLQILRWLYVHIWPFLFKRFACAHLIPPQSIISSAVQFFYAWRVKVVTGKIWVVLIITVSACISMRELYSLVMLVRWLIFIDSRGHWNRYCRHENSDFRRVRKIQGNRHHMVSTMTEFIIDGC